MVQTHIYRAEVQWSGSTALGYPSYSRAHSAFLPPATEGFDLSADPHFRGDPDLPNPEQLLVLAASSCQLLSFLAVAARRKVDVLRYEDHAVGEMPQHSVPLRITRIVLRPRVTVSADTDLRLVERLVLEAHEQCYISNSLTTQVTVEGAVTVSGPD